MADRNAHARRASVARAGNIRLGSRRPGRWGGRPDGEPDAALATRPVRNAARHRLFQRRRLEPAAARDAGGGTCRRRTQGHTLDAAGVVRQRDPRAHPGRCGRPDQCRAGRCGAGVLGRLRLRHRRQGAAGGEGIPRAGAGERSHLAGARVACAGRGAGLHGRGGAPAGRRRLDERRAGGDRAQGRGTAGAGVDLVGALVRRRS